MQRLRLIAAATVNVVGLLGCGASADEPEDQSSSEPADIAPRDQQQPAAAVQSDIESKQLGEVWLFWRTTDDGDLQFQGLLQATPRIESGCLKVGGAIVVWDQANLSVAEGLVAELQAGQVLGEVSLGGGVPPASLTMGITQQCGSGDVVFNGSSEVSVADLSDN
jgi:hypothetical protein